MRRLLLALSTSLGLMASPVVAESSDGAGTEACEGCEALLELAAANPKRKADAARDGFRHPVETMKFFGVRPDMKVGEYAPGGDWYSKFLASYLGKQGHLAGLFFDTRTAPFNDERKEGLRKGAAAFGATLAEYAEVPETSISGFTLDSIPEGAKGTYDRILLIRMLHNMLSWNIADSEVKTMRELLKDDGMLGIVQHRAKADAPWSYANGANGYLREADVIKFMELNGFKLVARSEVNANPKDSANWEKGVWTLPPSLTLKEQDKAKYEAIGESDRMTLLFKKAD